MDLFSEEVQDSFDDRFDMDRNGYLDPEEQAMKMEYLSKDRELSEDLDGEDD